MAAGDSGEWPDLYGADDTEEDYGLIRPSLIKQLRSILDQYPDDGQILKELIQNAEDAGATEVKFLHDETQYPTESLHHPDMAQFQGSALYAYNNARFERKDWTGIRMLQDSVKEKDPMKVGRFGLGFKSVLHMTDLPSVISGDRLFIIDPHEKYFKYKGDNSSGYSWNLQQKKSLMKTIPDQFEPYKSVFEDISDAFDSGDYNGTLFRFPLRKCKSRLSDTIYEPDRMRNLFESFQADSHGLMIFLKNLENIKLFKRSHHHGDCQLVYEVRLTHDCLDTVRNARRNFLARCKTTNNKEETLTYQVEIETLKYHDSGAVDRKVYMWLVNELRAGAAISARLETLRNDPTLSLVPLVGVAMPMKRTEISETPNDTPDTGTTQSRSERTAEGQIFCFLPLPVEQTTSTGLPVHVNGYFAISQNRRHLKWPTAGHNTDSDKSVLWNQCLIKELLPSSYAQLILHAIQVSQQKNTVITPADVYRAFPSTATVDEKWRTFLKLLYEKLFSHPIVFTERAGGKWVRIKEAVFDCSATNRETRRIITDVCHLGNVNIARVPDHILYAMRTYRQQSLTLVTPRDIRTVLRQNPTSYSRLTRPEKLGLLLYILGDGDFEHLQDIQLLPCDDGSFAVFHRQERQIYIPSQNIPRELFPGLEHLLVANNLPAEVMDKLTNMARAGSFQLRPFIKESAAAMISKVIPTGWYHKDQIMLDENSLYVKWLHHLWDFLGREYRRDRELSELSGLPILPLNTCQPVIVIPLSTSNNCVMKSAKGVELDRELTKILSIFSVHIVDDLPQYVQSHAAVLGSFLKLPFNGEILKVLVRCFNQQKQTDQRKLLRQVMDETSPTEKLTFLQIISELKSSHKSERLTMDFLREMPVFPTTKSVPGFSSIAKHSSAVRLDDLPCVPSMALLDVTNPSVQKAALLLGAEFVERNTAIRRYIFRDIKHRNSDAKTINKVITFIFENFAQFANDKSFLDDIAQLPFVSAGGQLKKPIDLYDPEDEILKVLFEEKPEMFPTDLYAGTQMLKILRQLGLKSSESLPGKELLGIMSTIERKQTVSTLSKSKCCLELFNQRPQLLFEDVEGMPLHIWARDLAWVPVTQQKSTVFPKTLPWCADRLTKKPMEVSSVKFASLVGSVKSIVDGVCHDELQNCFGWNESPALKDVIKQLNHIVKTYENHSHSRTHEKLPYLILTSGIYTYLIKIECTVLKKALTREHLSTWIWHGDGFVSTDCIFTEKLPLDVTPFLFTLPSEMSQFKSMFKACGVREHCEPNILIEVLVKMHNALDTDCPDSERNLQMAIDILNYISDQPIEDGTKTQLLVPTYSEAGFALIPIMSATYCDVQWIKYGLDMMEFDTEDGITFIHPKLPVATAEKLGVPTLMSRMLNAEELSITGFGQGEPLTSRLHHLLDDYSDGLAIVKEMIQNADDAGATEVSFLYDERLNEDCMEYLIDDGMKECQGPALWIHNNSEFTDQDFTNITRLGGATKEQEPEKIGRFGLGFNSVYNITDVPSFVSRNNIVMFDPHTYHLGKGIRDSSKPGIKIDMTKNKTLLRRLSHQFRPYQDIFNCDVDPDAGGFYNGTLFRLPLRTKIQAARSKISENHYDKGEMIALMNMTVKNAHTLLLFTQNVRTLKLLHIPPGGNPSMTKKLFSLEKNIERIMRENAITSESTTGETSFLSISSQYVKASTKSNTGQPQIPQSTILIRTSCNTWQNEIITSSDVRDKYWLVSACVGQKRSKKMCIESEGALVPVGGVAVNLAKTSEGYTPQHIEKSSGKSLAFCFLPLPVSTALPVHINGTFALATSRQHLSQSSDDHKTDRKPEWNKALLEDAVTIAYLQALCDLKKILPPNEEVLLYNVWPVSSEKYFHPLIQAFYKYMSSLKHIPLLYRNGKIFNIENSIFFQTPEHVPDQIAQLILEMFQLLDHSSHVLSLPAHIIKCIEDAGHRQMLDEKLYDIHRFYQEVFLPSIEKIDSTRRDALVVFALKRNDGRLKKMLLKTRCIPVTPTGSELKLITDIIHPTGLASRLYTIEDGYFPHGEVFTGGNMLRYLTTLGMQVDDLSWNYIIERARSCQKLEGLQMINTRYRNIMASIQRKLDHPSKKDAKILTEVRETLQAVPFLPFAKKPKYFPIPWSAENLSCTDRFCSSDLYAWDDRYLVSATSAVADEADMPLKTKVFLNLGKKSVTMKQVTTQLKQIMKIDVFRTCGEPMEYDELQTAITRVYTYIQHKLREGDEMAEHMCEMMHDRKCVLVKNRFLAPKDLVQKFPYDCAPYLYELPQEMLRQFKLLVANLKIREHFEAKDYALVLQIIHRESSGQPLDARQLDVAITVTTFLNAMSRQKKESVHKIVESCGEIYIPNAKRILQPSRALCYNDCPWITDTGVMNFTHPALAYCNSDCLGVKTKRQDALNKHAKGIPCGQKDRLTHSVKRMLKNYPCSHEIFKELIQIADNAEATEIHFICDFRTHSEKYLFDESWKRLQGPALCVYNNRPFTADEMEGIQLLDEGSKASDPSGTGQYGVSFSSVYHLTDAPSVLTDSADDGRSLCVFDPSCSFVPGATEIEPGMKYEHAEELEKIFPDVFTCYLPKQINLKGGTMMRFPLRTELMAKSSKISNQDISMSRIRKMLEELQNEAFEILLFSIHLEEIKLSEIDVMTGDVTNTYSVKILLSDDTRQSRGQIAQDMRAFRRSANTPCTTREQKQSHYMLRIKDNKGREETWCIAHTIGFKKGTDIPPNIRNAIREQNLTLVPQGGVACLLEKHLHDMPALINRKFIKMKVFCSQPLNIDISFPVHVNGHFVLMDETRRDLWNTEHANDYRNEWNNLLCTTVIAEAYVHLLNAIRFEILTPQEVDNDRFVCRCSGDTLKKKIVTYLMQFPMHDNVQSEWSPLVRAVYKSIARDNAPVLPIMQRKRNFEDKTSCPGENFLIRWVSPVNKSESNTFFCGEESCVSLWKDLLRDCGMNLIEIPQNIVKIFIDSGVEVEFVSPSGVLSFLKSKSVRELFSNLPCKISETPFLNEKNVHAIIKYCKGEKSFLQNLDGIPLLLTEDSILRVFDKDRPVFASLYADIVKERPDLFMKVTMLTESFQGTNIDSCCFFKKLTVSDVAESFSRNQDIKRVAFGSSHPVTWLAGGGSGLTKVWLTRLWTFLEDDANISQKFIRFDKTELTKLFKEWCLVPAEHGETNVLYSFGNANNAICLEGGELKWDQVCSILEELCIPKLDMAIVRSAKSGKSEIAKAVVTTLDQPRAILNLLHTKLQLDDKLGTSCLTTQRAEALMKYFVHHVGQLKQDDISVSLLRDLPIYTTICGDVISLSSSAVFTLPANIPTNGIDIWQSRAGMVFLERNEQYAGFYKMLGCVSISVVEVYCKFIFQHLEYFPEDDRMIHLHHVYQSYIKDGASHVNDVSPDEARSIRDTLKNLPLIPDNSGDLQPASTFYDPTHEVFRVMLAGDKFPPPTMTHIFSEREWYTFLGKVGLIKEMKKDMFINFAKQMAAKSYMHDADAAVAKSRALVQHLFSMPAHSREDIMSDMCTIKFVAQAKLSSHLTNVLPQYGDAGVDNLSLISFKDGVSQDFSHIVWTQMGVLPAWADPLKLNLPTGDKAHILDSLHMREKPRIETVVCHLITLSQHVNSSGPSFSFDTRTTIKDVFKEIYRFLKDSIDNDKDSVDKLSGESVVLVEDGTRVVKPRQTVVTFNELDEIKPWLFKFPTYLGEFADFFESLEATSVASVNQYTNVLEGIRERKGAEKLNPNERLQVLKAMRGVLEGLRTQKINKGSVSTLYLPTETGNMLDASKLVFNDVPSFYDRVKNFGIPFLLDPRECGADHHRAEEVMMNLPPQMRPRLLSAIVKEILHEGCKKTMRRDGLSSELDQRIKLNTFHSAVARLLRHNAQKIGQEIDDAHLQSTVEKLSTVNVYGVDDVITYLTHRDKPIADSRLNKVCFADKIQNKANGTCHWDMYIQNHDTLGNTLLLLQIAEFINRIVSGLLGDSVLYIIPILSCPEQDIMSQLKSMNIRVDQMTQADRQTFLPILGTPADDFVAQMRCQEADFGVGEFVGYRQGPDAPIIHAKVVEKVRPHGDEILYGLSIGAHQKMCSTDISQMHKYQ